MVWLIYINGALVDEGYGAADRYISNKILLFLEIQVMWMRAYSFEGMISHKNVEYRVK